MYLLTVKAYRDFDSPYKVNLCVSNFKSRMKGIVNTLNEFCETCSENNQNVRMSKILTDKERANELRSMLAKHLPDIWLTIFMKELIKICNEN